MASRALSSSGRHSRSPNLTKPSTPVVSSPETSGAAAIDVAGMRAALLDAALVVVGGWFGTEHHRLLAVFGLGEHRIGVGEIHQTERVGVGYVGPNRPLGDQSRRSDRVVVVPQEADVDAEVGREVGHHLLTDLDRGRRIGRHQLGGHRRDHQVETAGRGYLGHRAVRIRPVRREFDGTSATPDRGGRGGGQSQDQDLGTRRHRSPSTCGSRDCSSASSCGERRVTVRRVRRRRGRTGRPERPAAPQARGCCAVIHTASTADPPRA